MLDFLQNTVNGLLLGGLYALVGMGLAIIFGTMRVINFAHGQFIMIGMYVTYVLFSQFHMNPYASVVLSFVLNMLIGMGLYQISIRKLLNAPERNQILLTAGIGLVLTNLAQLKFSSDELTINLSYAYHDLDVGGLKLNIPYLISFGLAVLVTLLVFWFIMKTETGRVLRAVSQNRAVAPLMGINVHRVSALVFGIGIGLAGAAGTLLMPIHFVNPLVGDAYTLVAFVVVVLGGMGSILGAAVGGLIIGVIQTVSSFYLGSSYADVFTFTVFLIVLLLKPAGLFGRSRI